jgi:hypothetical protein
MLIRYTKEINNADLIYFTETAIPNTTNMGYGNLFEGRNLKLAKSKNKYFRTKRASV